MQKSFDLPVDWLTGNQARTLEPALSPRVVAAIHCPSDLQVNGRLMTNALTVAFQKAGGKLFEQTPVTKINIKDCYLQKRAHKSFITFIRLSIIYVMRIFFIFVYSK